MNFEPENYSRSTTAIRLFVILTHLFLLRPVRCVTTTPSSCARGPTNDYRDHELR